jgi:2-succinyl-5-enolpyruvyl-6-hydroxy-3-cyclohexene-1-carboxylate synthase
MKPRTPNISYFWGSLIVGELVRNGVDTFCIAPGSRSSPLAIAAARHPGTRRVVHFDERGLAFHALGLARATGRPAAVITTSGTAVANLLPAVVESSMAGVPMILLTADRPPELRDAGANQAVDQVGVFGSYVRWQFDVPCPDEAIPASFVLTTVDQAVHRATSSPRGPVHLNLMFREPLAPVPDGRDLRAYVRPLRAWLRSNDPFTRYARPDRRPSVEAVGRWGAIVRSTRRGLVVAGPTGTPDGGPEILRLAKALGWPVLADVQSPLRFGANAGDWTIPGDAVLLSTRFASRHRPDTILRIGGRPVSKRIARFIAESGAAHHVVVQDHPLREDPDHGVTLRIECDAAALGRLAPRGARPGDRRWLRAWQGAARAAAAAWECATFTESGLTEPQVAGLISKHARRGHGIFLGNSMPVRDADACPLPGRGFQRVYANRGASGIDGTIATAAGIARGSGRGLTAALGDLAALHDLNSLALVRQLATPLVLVVLNNDGGGIFSFLPVAAEQGVFEELFGMPHGLGFREACAMFSIPFEQPRTAGEFIAAYERAAGRPGPSMIEVRTDRPANRGVHEAIQRAVAAAVDGAGGG